MKRMTTECSNQRYLWAFADEDRAKSSSIVYVVPRIDARSTDDASQKLANVPLVVNHPYATHGHQKTPNQVRLAAHRPIPIESHDAIATETKNDLDVEKPIAYRRLCP